jgi:hypothetical protein
MRALIVVISGLLSLAAAPIASAANFPSIYMTPSQKHQEHYAKFNFVDAAGWQFDTRQGVWVHPKDPSQWRHPSSTACCIPTGDNNAGWVPGDAINLNDLVALTAPKPKPKTNPVVPPPPPIDGTDTDTGLPPGPLADPLYHEALNWILQQDATLQSIGDPTGRSKRVAELTGQFMRLYVKSLIDQGIFRPDGSLSPDWRPNRALSAELAAELSAHAAAIRNGTAPPLDIPPPSSTCLPDCSWTSDDPITKSLQKWLDKKNDPNRTNTGNDYTPDRVDLLPFTNTRNRWSNSDITGLGGSSGGGSQYASSSFGDYGATPTVTFFMPDQQPRAPRLPDCPGCSMAPPQIRVTTPNINAIVPRNLGRLTMRAPVVRAPVVRTPTITTPTPTYVIRPPVSQSTITSSNSSNSTRNLMPGNAQYPTPKTTAGKMNIKVDPVFLRSQSSVNTTRASTVTTRTPQVSNLGNATVRAPTVTFTAPNTRTPTPTVKAPTVRAPTITMRTPTPTVRTPVVRTPTVTVRAPTVRAPTVSVRTPTVKAPTVTIRVPTVRTPTITSDVRLKRDIASLGRLPNGLVLYRYRYLWSDTVYVGVMAQEVLTVAPDAVSRGADGFFRVDYGRLGLQFRTWDQWTARGGEKTRLSRH